MPRNSADPAPEIKGDAPPLLPRLVRLAEKLDLVDKEKRALEFIIVSVIGTLIFKINLKSQTNFGVFLQQAKSLVRVRINLCLFLSGD